MAAVPQKTLWQKTKTGSKFGFDKLWGYADKLGAPVNRLSNKLGSEAFWPTTIDKESEKAARILRSFCKDGFYQEEKYKSVDGPTMKQRVLKKIPTEVIRKAKGLAIFTTMRTGLWVSGAGGSGILVARLEDGSWSPPTGILLHTAGLGFLVGVDIYDCVLVLNTQEAVNAFAKWRCTVGTEISAVAGPVGMGGVLETEVHKKNRVSPIFTYLKSRGFYAGVQVDGTVIIERTDENERFYGQQMSAVDILSGKIRHPPKYELQTLWETLKAAQGDKDVDETLLTSEPPPADFEIEEEGHVFGVPDPEDPDPFGVRALEKEGFVIKEAGTEREAPEEAFDFNPKISSPVYDRYHRKSTDSGGQSVRSSWRASTLGNLDKKRPMSDSSTQTDFQNIATPTNVAGSPIVNSPTVASPIIGAEVIKMEDTELATADGPASTTMGQQTTPRPVHAVSERQALDVDSNDVPTVPEHKVEDADSDDDAEYEDAEIHEVQVQQAVAPQVIKKVQVVSIPKRIPPTLPPRNPQRSRLSPERAPIDAARVSTQNLPERQMYIFPPLHRPRKKSPTSPATVGRLKRTVTGRRA